MICFFWQELKRDFVVFKKRVLHSCVPEELNEGLTAVCVFWRVHVSREQLLPVRVIFVHVGATVFNYRSNEEDLFRGRYFSFTDHRSLFPSNLKSSITVFDWSFLYFIPDGVSFTLLFHNDLMQVFWSLGLTLRPAAHVWRLNLKQIKERMLLIFSVFFFLPVYCVSSCTPLISFRVNVDFSQQLWMFFSRLALICLFYI